MKHEPLSYPGQSSDDEESRVFQKLQRSGNIGRFLVYEPLGLILEWERQEEERLVIQRFVKQLYAKLTSKQRIVFDLHYLQGLEAAEIAEVMECSPQNVYSYLRKINKVILANVTEESLKLTED